MVYALPKTELCIEIETEKITLQPGVFYRYSERYLATKNVITEERTTFRIKSMLVKACAIPDASRTFSFVPLKNSQLSKLSVNEQGILCGVNTQVKFEYSSVLPSVLPVKDIPKSSSLLPLGEEYMMAGSEAKLAEGAAKQIYRIRESRLSLLTADVEKLPSDGASFESMLEGMNKMESELTALFVGRTISERKVEKVTLVPDTTLTNKVLFRFSALRGLVASDDLSGIPYYISVKHMPIPVKVADSKVKPEKGGLYYVIPAATEVSVGDGKTSAFAAQFLIPQFGKTVQLPESLFKQSTIKVLIDSQTGRLLSVE